MSLDPEPAEPRQGGAKSMFGWLAFFLLVFVVAGVAFYLAGDPGPVSEKPAAVTQK